MITFPALPAWAWKAIAAVGLVSLAVWWHQHHAVAVVANAVEAAVLVERKVWTDAQAVAQIQQDTKVAILEMVAETNMETFRRESQARYQALQASNARLSASAVSLQHTINDWRKAVDSAASESPGCGPIADAARVSGEVFGECSAEYGSLAKEAGRLASKVKDLQSYITSVVGGVCIASDPEEFMPLSPVSGGAF